MPTSSATLGESASVPIAKPQTQVLAVLVQAAIFCIHCARAPLRCLAREPPQTGSLQAGGTLNASALNPSSPKPLNPKPLSPHSLSHPKLLNLQKRTPVSGRRALPGSSPRLVHGAGGPLEGSIQARGLNNQNRVLGFITL